MYLCVCVCVCVSIDDERTVGAGGGASAMSLLGGAHLRAFAEHDARAMEAATRAMEEVSKRMEEASRAAALATAHSGAAAAGNTAAAAAAVAGMTVGGHHGGPGAGKYVDVAPAPPPRKRPALFDDEHRFLSQFGVPTARLKMTTQSELNEHGCTVVTVQASNINNTHSHCTRTTRDANTKPNTQ